MTKDKPAADGGAGNFRAYYALVALVVGLVAGMLAESLGAGARDGALGVASFVGTLWLNALKMTVSPLVVALLVVGIVARQVWVARRRAAAYESSTAASEP